LTQLRTAPSRDSLTRALSETASVQVDLDSDLETLLDPMRDVEDLTPLLDVPAKYSGTTRGDRAERPMYSSTEDTDLLPRTPRHRRQPTSAARGRMLIAAMAVGAAAAASYSTATPNEEPTSRTVLAAEKTPIAGAPMSRGVELVTVKPVANAAVHAEELAKGVAYAAERAEREARLQRPLFVLPAKGMFTSGFGYRWGALHGGVDLAGPIGTPIYAASDGVVADAGPTNSGYGAWVKIRHSDGTVTLYGHINSWTVQIGQRVFAGDQIATIGNRGYSTGPHLHFEVLLGGTSQTDPVPWLAARGVSLGGYVG
jgi:murein DD-endopeptidase MepM/ murein hydrolase activator NlpD